MLRSETKMNKVSETKPRKIFIGCLPKDTTLENLRDFLASKVRVLDLQIKTRNKSQEGMCLGHASLTTDYEGAERLLSGQQLFFQSRLIVFAPFHDGDALEYFQSELNERRIFVILKFNLHSP